MTQQKMNTPNGGVKPFSITANFNNAQNNFTELYSRTVSIEDFGAKCDFAKITCNVASGSANVSKSSGFESSDVGKYITIWGAGATCSPPTVLGVVRGTTGATAYTYYVTSITSAGESTPSAAVNITTGNATLNGQNYNEIQISPVSGALSYNVYRYVGGKYYKANSSPIKKQLYYYDVTGTYSATETILSTNTANKHITGTILSVDGAGVATISTTASITASSLTCTYGSDDTDAINAALASGSGVIVGPLTGGSLIRSPLVFYSNTKLCLSPLFTVHKQEDIGGWMWTNRSVVNVNRALTGVSITSGTTTLSATGGFTNSDIGKTVVIQGAGTNYYALTSNAQSLSSTNHVANIIDVSGGNAIISIAAKTTVSGGNANLYTRDNNIYIEGGIWDHGYSFVNPSVTIDGICTAAGRNVTFLRHIDGLEVCNLTMTSKYGKYAIFPGDVTDVKVHDIKFNVNADGVHVTGPASNINVYNISGSVGDDAVTAHASDWDDCDCDIQGDIYDYHIGNINMITPNAIVRLHGAQGLKIRSIFASSLYGEGHGALYASDVSEGLSDIDNVVFDKISFKSTVPGAVFSLSTGAGGSISIKNIYINPLSILSNIYSIGGSWNDIDLDLVGIGCTFAHAVFVKNAQVGRLKGKIFWRGSSPSSLKAAFYITGTSVVEHICCDDFDVDGFLKGIYISNTATVKDILLKHPVFKNFSGGCLGYFLSSVDVTLIGGHCATTSGYPTLFFVSGSGVVLTLRGNSCFSDASSGAGVVILANGAVYRCLNKDLPIVAPTVAATVGTATMGGYSTDFRGKVTLSGVTTSSVVTLTYNSSFISTPAPVVSPIDSSGVGMYISNRNATSFQVTVPTGCTGFTYNVDHLQLK